MPMMHIRKVRMAMPHHSMCMLMAMRHLRVPLKPMLMLMMLIMHMPVPMLRCLMHMLMGMPLRQVQPIQTAAVTDSPNTSNATAAPRKGAVEK